MLVGFMYFLASRAENFIHGRLRAVRLLSGGPCPPGTRIFPLGPARPAGRVTGNRAARIVTARGLLTSTLYLPIDRDHGDGEEGDAEVPVAHERKGRAEKVPVNPAAVDEPGGTERKDEEAENEVGHAEAETDTFLLKYVRTYVTASL